MELTVFLVLFGIVLVVVVLLPLISGVGSYKYQKSLRLNQDDDQSSQQSTSYSGYVPPEELKRIEEENRKKNSKFQKLKNISLSKQDLPIKFTTGDGNQQIRNRKGKAASTIDRDPSVFDYDIDELINEANEDDLREQEQEFQRRAAHAKEYVEDIA